MAFTISQKLETATSYPGLVMEVPGDSVTVDVTYEVQSLSNLSGSDAVVDYSISIGGVTSAWIRQFKFTYSGTGNPLTEGETALQASLTTGS